MKPRLLAAACAVLLPAWTGPAAAAPEEPERLLFGVVPGNYWMGDIERDMKYLSMLEDLGVTHANHGFNWDNIERERGKYAWDGWDYAVDMYVKHGIRLEGVIVGCPEWALPKSGDLGWMPVALNMPREDCIPDFERFVTAVAQRYAGKVDRFEFWNEPNGYNMAPTVGENDPKYKGKIELYTKFLKIAYAALKKGNPKAVLACGGIDSGGVRGIWLEGLYANGAKDAMDAVNIHPYSNAPPYIDEAYMKKTREIMEAHGDKDKPVWITEYGTFNPGKPMLDTAFDTVKDKYPNVTLLTLHTFKDFRAEDGLQAWGLVDRNLAIKPTGGYEAFKAYPKPPRKPLPVTLTGPCSIAGTLTDLQLHKPIPDVFVVAMPGAFITKTDAKGTYSLANLPEGTYRVTCRPPGFTDVKAVEVALTAASAAGTADFPLSREVLPPAEGEAFDPAKDRADAIPGNLVKNGSFDDMENTPVGQLAKGWDPFNTVQHMTYTAGASVGGEGLSQMMGHGGQAVQQGIEQKIATEAGKKYRLTFWFAYTGQGAVGDTNNCTRVGFDFDGGEWKQPNPGGKKPFKYGFPKTLQWDGGAGLADRIDLAGECAKRGGGEEKAAKKWFKLTREFTATGPATTIWFEAAAGEGQNSRKYLDEVSVVRVE